jgi:hypothetical protein
MTGSQRAYAKHRKELGLAGGSLAAVQKALKTSRITKGSDGQIEFARADRDWEANLNQRKARRPKSAAKAAPLPAGDPDKAADPSEIPPDNFLEAQRQSEWLKVQKQEMELRLRREELAEVSDFEEAHALIVASAQSRLLGLAGKLGPKVAGMSDPRECSALIDREIREVLSALTEFKLNAAA